MGVFARRAVPWLAVCTAATLALLGTGTGSARAATTMADGTGVVLPQDEAPHQTPDEWWYFNGHLCGVDPAGHPHCYGYEYVTFKFLNSGSPPVYFGNFAVTDQTRGTFQYDVRPIPTRCPARSTASRRTAASGR